MRKQDRVYPSSTGVSIRVAQLTPTLTMQVVGVAKANELLIFGKRKTARELLECGFYK